MIPNYQECMLPLLQLLSDNQVHTSKECVEKLWVSGFSWLVSFLLSV